MTKEITSAASIHRIVKPCYRLAAATALQQGWRISTTNNNHLKWQPPVGQPIFGPSTPSDRRGIENLIHQLKRAGLRFPA